MRASAGLREILVACPQARDRAEIRAAGLDRAYDVRFHGPDLDRCPSFDARALVEELASLPADGVVGTKDRSALVAALVAGRLGLPGPRPESLVACQHKPTARAAARRLVPDATPRFAVLDEGPPRFPPPYFVKPIVGRLSQRARRIERVEELGALELEDPYAQGYAALAELAGFPSDRFRGFVVEELLEGDEVTLEGYVHAGRMTVIGVTDSVKYPGSNSFERFEYPSRLPAARLGELGAIAQRLLPALGFDGGFFNVEFFVPEAGSARIIEVNGRIASQFAPLVRALQGRSTYEALFALACGDDPGWRAGTPDGVAISYVVRVFADALVAGVPEPEDGLEVLVRAGLPLSEQGAANDVGSYRLAIFTESGETREDALARCRRRAESLNFRLEPVRAG